MSDKTLNVVDSKDLQNKISDVEIFGNADLFKLAAKALNELLARIICLQFNINCISI